MAKALEYHQTVGTSEVPTIMPSPESPVATKLADGMTQFGGALQDVLYKPDENERTSGLPTQNADITGQVVAQPAAEAPRPRRIVVQKGHAEVSEGQKAILIQTKLRDLKARLQKLKILSAHRTGNVPNLSAHPPQS